MKSVNIPRPVILKYNKMLNKNRKELLTTCEDKKITWLESFRTHLSLILLLLSPHKRPSVCLDITQTRRSERLLSETSLVCFRTGCVSLDIPAKRRSSLVWSQNKSLPVETVCEMCQLFTCSFPQAALYECAPLSGTTLTFSSYCFGTVGFFHSYNTR